MSEDHVRVWLVDRAVTEKPSLINHIYATEDGSQSHLIERSTAGSTGVEETTAAIDIDPEKLSAVEDEELREEYAAEATRMAERHQPTDAV